MKFECDSGSISFTYFILMLGVECFPTSEADFWVLWHAYLLAFYPADICLFKVNTGKTIAVYEICSKLIINHWRRSGVFNFNFEQI